MLLVIRPDAEQSIRNRIAVLRETIGEATEDSELIKQRSDLDKLEKQLGEFETREDFRKIAREYWSSNEVQLLAAAQVLQEIGAEIERIARLAEEANKLNKKEIAGDLEKRIAELSGILEKLLEFTPVKERTGEHVMHISGCWEKLKSAKVMIEFLQEMANENESEAVDISKKLAAENKRMARIKEGLSKKSSTSEYDEQKMRVAQVEARDSVLKAEIRRRKKMIFDLQASIPDLNAQLKKTVVELSARSSTNALTEGAGKPLKELLTSYSIPQMRALVENSAAEIPRDTLVKRHEAASLEYEELRQDFVNAAAKAKARARCKRCKEATEALLSGAVDHDSPEVKACVGFLQDGDMFQAKKAFESAFATGNIHEYVRADLEKMMKELLELYDQKGEVSKAEEKLKQIGTKMIYARLDLMKLDYISSGVHSPSEFFKAAAETLKWLEGIGIVFGQEVRENLEKINGSQEIFRISDIGFTKEQALNAQALLQTLKTEADLLGKIKNSEIVEEIAKKEASIASTVSASENFENPFFLRSLLSGDKNAIEIMNRLLENSGDEVRATEAYINATIQKEALGLVGSDIAEITQQASKIKDLCTEIGKLRITLSKKSDASVSQKLTLGRKAQELKDCLDEFIGEKIDDSLSSKINDAKIDGEKLYLEIMGSPQVAQAIRNRLLEHSKTLKTLRAAEEVQGTPLNSTAS